MANVTIPGIQFDGLDARLNGDLIVAENITTSNGDIEIQNSGVPKLTIDDTGNGGGGGASGKITFKNNSGDAIAIGYTNDNTSSSDLIISTDASSTYGGYLNLDAAAITDTQADIILDPKSKVHVTKNIDVYKYTNTSGTATGSTLLTLSNNIGTESVAGDLNQQKTFIDFGLYDSNSNEVPQVRIGAEVGENGNADSQEKEGSGAFVVYTNDATGNGPSPTGLNERLRVDYQGRVGIGTATPAYTIDTGETTIGTLRMVGDNGHAFIRLGAGGGGNNVTLIRVDGETNNHDGESDSGQYGFSLKYLGSGSGNDNAFGLFADNQNAASQVESFRVKQDGKLHVEQNAFFNGTVSVGTTAANYKLQLRNDANNSDPILLVQNESNGSTAAATIWLDSQGSNGFIKTWGDGNANTNGTWIGSTAGGSYIAFAPGNTDKMRVFESGNVGIGANSPSDSARLQVRIGGIGTSANDEVDGVIFEGDRHDLIFKQIRTAAATDWNSTTFRLQNQVDSTLMSSIDFTTDASYNRHIDINTASNTFNTRFTHDGKVGIGTTSPAVKFEVNGSGYFQGGTVWNGGGTESDKADIALVIDEGDTIYTRDSGQYLRILIKKDTGDNIQIGQAGTSLIDNINFFSGSSCSYTWHNNSSAAMKLTSTGLGIGVTSPDDALEIYGSQKGIKISNTAENAAGILWVDVQDEAQQASIKYDCGDNKLKFYNTTGVRMVINNSGRVGIGTDSPDARFQVVHTGVAQLIIGYNGNSQNFFDADTQYFRSGSGSTRMLLNGTGLGIGTTAPAYKLDVDTTFNDGIYLRCSGTGDAEWLFSSSGTNNFYIKDINQNAERLRINTSGYLGVLETNPQYELDVDGDIHASGDVIAFSDISLKENIKTIDNSLEKVNKLRGVEFNKIGSHKKSIGVIAQEIEKVLPEVVKENDEGIKSVAYGNITGILIEAVKELKQEIETLKTQINN